MRTISLNNNVLALEFVNYFDFPPPLDRRERIRLSIQLDLQCIDVISVHMCVAELDDKFACLRIGDMRHHVREERVGRDVEGDSKPEVGRSLKHETREPRFLARFLSKVYIELAHHMTGWQRHEGHRCVQVLVESDVTSKVRFTCGVPSA